MKEGYLINRYISTLFYILCGVIAVGFVCVQIFYPSEREPESGKDALIYEGMLTWEKGDGTKEQITVPGDYENPPGQTMVIKMMLPYDYDDNTIAIRASQQSVRFYIDNELRSEYDTKNSRIFGSNSASRYVFCKTFQKDAGKELCIELLSNSKKYSGVVNQIYMGDKLDIWNYIAGIYGGELVIAFFILFSGIITIIFSGALSIAYMSKINLEYLGWCMVFGAVWMLGESKLRQLFISNVSGLASLCFVVVMLCPIPILFYVDSVQKGEYHKLFEIIECIAVVNLGVSSFLQFAEIADYLDTLFISHLIMVIAFVAVFITFFLDYRKGRIKEYLLIVIGLMIAMVLACVEVISVYFVVSISGLFIGIGLLVLLFFNVVKTVKDIRDLENKRHAEQVEKRKKQVETMALQMIQTLSTTIEAKDEYTRGHSHRVAEYSALIAKELGWSCKEVENLRNAAHLHDIGKIGVPDTILNKPAKLWDSEYEIIKSHTTIGADILKNITLIENVDEVARYHHERYDGKGYPLGLSGEDIPIQARIVAIADSFDAMNYKRIYRNSLPKDMIRKEIINNRGLQFDPKIADAFLKLLDENRLEIEEDVPHIIAGKALSEIEINKTMEAGQFVSDVMDTIKKQNKVENLDYITGLPMRNTGEILIAKKIQENPGYLVFLDMDNLKKINDIFGHRAGDKALKMLGDTLTNCTEDYIACRAGGDEFIFFISNVSKESATKIIEHIFKVFYAEKNKNMETSEASLSVGICVCQKGDSFEECLAKTDKALYYVKQNGKDNYSFYHEISQENMQNTSKKDLEQVAKALRNSGSYTGAFDIEHREFAKLYEYMCNLGERYKHTCHLVMITIDAASNDNMLIEKQEKAMECMEIAVLSNIRNVDICTRYSSIQCLVMLVESREENIPSVMERIFSQYYKLYKHNEFHPAYEFLSMLPAWNESKE